jgi:hypothetical protein
MLHREAQFCHRTVFRRSPGCVNLCIVLIADQPWDYLDLLLSIRAAGI